MALVPPCRVSKPSPGAGQPKGRVTAQPTAFRPGTRANDDDAVMRAFACGLNNAEVEGLDNFYAAASAPQGGVRKPAQ